MKQRTTRTAAVLLTAGVSAFTAAGCGDDDPQADPAVAVTTTVAPKTTTTTIPIDRGIYGVAVTQVVALGGSPGTKPDPGPLYSSAHEAGLWVGMHRVSAVVHVDATTGAILKTVSIDQTAGSMKPGDLTATKPATGTGAVLATDNAVWVLDLAGFVWRIDPATNEIVARIELPNLLAESGAAVDDRYLWVVTSGNVARIDLETNKLAGTFPVGGTEGGNGPNITTADGAVWTNTADGQVRVDAETGKVVATIRADGHPVAASDGLVWGLGIGGVWAVDPETNQIVKEVPKPDGVAILNPDGAAVDGGNLSVLATPTDPTAYYKLMRLDLASGTWSGVDLMNREFDFTIGLSADNGTVWASDFGRGNMLRVPQE